MRPKLPKQLGDLVNTYPIKKNNVNMPMNMTCPRRHFLAPYVPLAFLLQPGKHSLPYFFVTKLKTINSNKPTITRITYTLVISLTEWFGMPLIKRSVTISALNKQFLRYYSSIFALCWFVNTASRVRHVEWNGTPL